MLHTYHKNKKDIDDYLWRKQNKIENYVERSDTTLLGLSIGVFLFILLVNLAILIIAIILLVKNQKYMPQWAFVSGIVLLLFFPLISLLFALFIRK